jgi:hypothetical protein
MKGKVLIPPRFLIVAETMAKKKKDFLSARGGKHEEPSYRGLQEVSFCQGLNRKRNGSMTGPMRSGPTCKT